MSQPIRLTSHDGVNSTGPGKATRTKGHLSFGLYVRVDNVPSGTTPAADDLEVRLEGSATDQHFVPLDYSAPTENDAYFIDGDDLVQSDEDGTVWAAYVGSNNYPIENVRANIVTFTLDAEVSTYIYLNGWSQRGVSYKAVEERDVTPPTRID